MATQAKRFEDLDPEKTTFNEEKKNIDNSSNEDSNNDGGLYFDKKTADGKLVLTEDAAPECTGHAFSSKKKWLIAAVVAYIQLSMNYNASGVLVTLLPYPYV